MHTRIFSKLTFLAAAVLINALMFAGVNYLFDGQHERIARASPAQGADGVRLLYS
jgi:hypothetical protein